MSDTEIIITGLIIVAALLVLVKIIQHFRKEQPEEQGAPVTETVPQNNAAHIPGEVIAAIMAAITAEEEAQGVPYGNFRVVAFRRIGRN